MSYLHKQHVLRRRVEGFEHGVDGLAVGWLGGGRVVISGGRNCARCKVTQRLLTAPSACVQLATALTPRRCTHTARTRLPAHGGPLAAAHGKPHAQALTAPCTCIRMPYPHHRCHHHHHRHQHLFLPHLPCAPAVLPVPHAPREEEQQAAGRPAVGLTAASSNNLGARRGGRGKGTACQVRTGTTLRPDRESMWARVRRSGPEGWPRLPPAVAHHATCDMRHARGSADYAVWGPRARTHT